MPSYEREKEAVEDYLVEQTRIVLGGEARKLQDLGKAGWPDRTLIWFPRNIHYVECKSPTRPVLRPSQKRTHKWLASMGFRVSVVSSRAQVDSLLKKLRARSGG